MIAILLNLCSSSYPWRPWLLTPESNAPTLGPVTPPTCDPIYCRGGATGATLGPASDVYGYTPVDRLGRHGHVCRGVPSRRLWVSWQEARGDMAVALPALPFCQRRTPEGGATTPRLDGSAHHCPDEPPIAVKATRQRYLFREHSIDSPPAWTETPIAFNLCFPDRRYLAVDPDRGRPYCCKPEPWQSEKTRCLPCPAITPRNL